jgi:SAM-dependent methyltransferase
MNSGAQETKIDEMISVNAEQANFYESIQQAEQDGRSREEATEDGYASNEKAGLLTRFWASLRANRKKLLKSAGTRDRVEERFRELMVESSAGRVLEIGCFNGTRNSLWIIDRCEHYTGIDLSASAIKVLESKVAERGVSHKVDLVVGDLLSFESEKPYDLIYAQGVLHHFRHPEVLFAILHRLLGGGGKLVFSDPSEVNAILQLFRRLYRPFQTDQAWEWPFSKQTVAAMADKFQVIDAFGFGRISSLMVPIVSIPVLGNLLGPVYQGLVNWELNRPFSEQDIWQQAVVYGLAVRRD